MELWKHSARELIMIHDEMLMVWGFTVDSVNISYMLGKLLKH